MALLSVRLHSILYQVTGDFKWVSILGQGFEFA